MNHYYHWGKIGDIVYSLPTVRVLGAGHYITALPKPEHDWLAPLLEVQPYITGVSHDPTGKIEVWRDSPPGVTHDLNIMRLPQFAPLHIRSLVTQHGLPFGLNLSWYPWLTVPDLGPRQNRAVVARSPRYQDPLADWSGHLAELRMRYVDVVFVGTEDEHQAFGRGLPRVECPTALDMARLIGESSYFAGNQSGPLSMAIGLGIPHTIEIGPGHSNCTFHDCPYQTPLPRMSIERETWRELTAFGLISMPFEEWLAMDEHRRRPFQEQVRRSFDDHAGIEERRRRLLALGSSC